MRTEIHQHKQIEIDPPGTAGAAKPAEFLLAFEPIHNGALPMVFPCSAEGRIDVDVLGESARNELLLAKVLVGRDFHPSEVVRMH